MENAEIKNTSVRADVSVARLKDVIHKIPTYILHLVVLNVK